MYQSGLGLKPVAALLFLSIIWGANMAIIKIGAQELPPLFMAGLRSLIASICLLIWMKAKKVPLFPSKTIICHGILVGLFFGIEFGLIYMGLNYTLASHVYILLYTAPFFVALGAHIFLKDDRLNTWKSVGLIFAFIGVAFLLFRETGTASKSIIIGDIMALCAGLFWGATTVYIKKFIITRTVPLQTLFYQVLFSAPLLLLMSFIGETFTADSISIATYLSLFYQCIIVAFLSFLAWFELLHRYPASLLHAFSFFTPVCGVFLSGVLILHEFISMRLIIALVMVSVGVIMVNHFPSKK